jgi:hypothetical protein
LPYFSQKYFEKMSNVNEQRESDIEFLRQMCCYITTDPYDILDHRLAYYKMEGNSDDDYNIHKSHLEKELCDYLKRMYPLISASIYDLDKAYNELSNAICSIDHPQDMELRTLLHTAYSEMNELRKEGKNIKLWRVENKSLYGKIKYICFLLLTNPYSVIHI